MKTYHFPILIVIIFVFAGCSSGPMKSGEPISPNTQFTQDFPVGISDKFPDGTPAGGFGLMGIYSLYIDFDNMSAELNSIRSLALTDTLEVVDITNFLKLAPCNDCAKISSVSLNSDGNTVLSIGIKHPFAVGDPFKPITGRNRGDLHVFNVEGIVANQASSSTSFPSLGKTISPAKQINASGYSSYLDDILDTEVFQTDADIHPYILHFADYSAGNFDALNPMGFDSVTDPPPSGNLVMAMGCDYDYRDYVFDLDEDVSFTLALGCTYAVSSASKNERFSPEYRVPQHLKKAASEVMVIPPVDKLSEVDPQIEVTFQVHVVDRSHGVEAGENLDQMLADSSVGSVIIEIPNVLSSTVTQSGGDAISGTGHDPSDPLVYEFTISNEGAAPSGIYRGLVKVLDTYPPGLNTSPLLSGMDGIKRVDPLANPLTGLFMIDEFATYATFDVEVEFGFVGSDPVAVITRSDTGCFPVEVFFDASESTDADDDPMSIPLNFEFDFDYDEITFTVDRPMSTDPLASHLYTVPGCYLAAVRVTDSHNNPDIATVVVPIGDFNPVGTDSDITDGSTITNIDFIHGAPTFVGDIRWPDRSDPSKGSARGSGNIYTVFYGEEGGSRKIFFSRSSDDETWSAPVAVHTYDSTGLYSGCSIAADDTGQVLIVWTDHFHRDLGLEYSFDNGDTFASQLIRDESDCMYWCDKHRMPDVAIDPTNPDNIIVSCNYNRYGTSGWYWGWDQMYVDYSSTGPAGTFNEVLHILPTDWRPGWVTNIYRIHAHYAIDGDAYIIAGENNNIHVFRSQDFGATWPDHLRYEIAPWHRDFDSTMDPTDSEVFYVAASRRDALNMELYKSTDGLNVSQIQGAINDSSSGYRMCPSVTINDAGVVYYMWHTNGSGTYDIMSDYSCDGGATFGTDVMFNTDDIGNEVDPDLIPNACGDGVVCLWEQSGDQSTGKLVSRRG